MLKLNLGSLECPIDGYENIDRCYADRPEKYRQAYPLQWEDGCADEVRASHILEHFSHKRTMDVLNDWVRVLKPGGTLKVAVPDFMYCVNAYLSESDEPISSYIMGGHSDTNDIHGALFDEGSLSTLLAQSGLVGIKRWESEITDCASLPVSLNLQGTKPADGYSEREEEPAEDIPEEVPADQPKLPANAVRAIISMPRVGFTENFCCWMNALVPLGIPTQTCTGVYWARSLGELMNSVLETDAKYILTMDYDTVFSQQQVVELLYCMETMPEIDALASVQMRRDAQFPLMTMDDGSGKKLTQLNAAALNQRTMPIMSAHFGLTVLRTESLRKAKKPWFLPVPDSDGGFDEAKGKVDDDVYFWLNWHKSGLTLHQANRAVVGHIQQMITWPNKILQPYHQFIPDWHKNGKPGIAL